MTAILSLLLFVALGLWVRHRHIVKDRRAGLDGLRPTFTVEPPARRVGRLKDGHL